MERMVKYKIGQIITFSLLGISKRKGKVTGSKNKENIVICKDCLNKAEEIGSLTENEK